MHSYCVFFLASKLKEVILVLGYDNLPRDSGSHNTTDDSLKQMQANVCFFDILIGFSA